MLRFILPLASLVAIVVAEPSWGYGGYGGHHAAAPLGADGRVVDTPEVAAAKSAHLAALADASARAGPAAGAPGAWGGPAHGAGGWGGPAGAQYAPRYHGPPAPLGPDGRVVDTAEVAAAKAHHFSLYNAAAQGAPAGPAAPAHYDSGAYNPAWDGPSYDGAWNDHGY